ncbi:alpha/beta fold hydrolase [Phenylobacterium immobile]|uniref:alpha/beta fold hydrolase n=1 Tax=Phenylobacterium immobile TaxID=21 RepID=UPI000B2A584B|nr:alpha/beta hydrolase [Phenylobacterium immobile]
MGLELEKDTRSRGLTEEGIIHIPGIYSRYVRLASGARAHYVTSGESGPAVILLHGGIEGSSGTAGFRFMMTFLGENGFRVYAPDRPGFGKADTSKVEYLDASPKAQVDFVKEFADALCLDKFHLSGNSAGCMVSANFVVSHPERVLSVAFIAGGLGDINEKPRLMPSEGKFTPNPAYVNPPFDGTNESMKNLMDGIIYEAKAIWPELITMRVNDALEQRRAREAAGVERWGPGSKQTPDQLQVFSTKGRLDKLTMPMIYLYGLQDVLSVVENGFNQEDVAPNIQFFYPDECGHQGQTDQPDMHNQVFLEFFREGKVSWESAKWAGVSRRRPINPKLVEEPAGGFPSVIREAYVDTPTLRAALGSSVKTPEPAE